MAKQANRMLIGVFVVIAVVILAVSLVIFGSGNFFQATDKYVLYFDGSIKGLNEGAPVLFQGVTVGSVSSIVIRADRDRMKVEIPVIIEIKPDRFEIVGTGKLNHQDPENRLAPLIDAGMRAVLTIQSLITGQLLIEIDFFPNTPVNLRNVNEEYPEIPTIHSTTERLAQSFSKLNLEEIQQSLERTLSGIDALVNAPELKASISELKGVLSDSRALVGDLHGKIAPIVDNFSVTLHDVDQLVNNTDNEMMALTGNLHKAIRDLSTLARNADGNLELLFRNMKQTLEAVRGISSEDAPLIVELENTLQSITNMARAFRELADYLERHPEALLKGKGNGEGN